MNLTCARLNKIAENKRWNPATDIDWIFRTGNQQFPCIPDANPLVGFDEYEKLPIDTRRQISWRYHKMEISEILHGEQLAMLCASQLMTLMPCMESRLFTSRQAADEARHFEFFRDYLDSVDLSVCPPSPALKRLTVEALQSPHWEIKLLICQVLIESLAMAQFSQLARTTQVTSLRQGLRRILDDEARHVKFGADYLAAHFQHHNADNIIVLSNYIMLEITSLRRPLNWPRPTIIVSPSPLLFVGTSINYAIICADNESTTRHSYNRDSGNFLSISRR